MRTALLAPLAVVLALALPAGAQHCTTWTTSVTTDATVVVATGVSLGGSGFYVANDLCNVPRYNPEGDGIHVSFGHDFAHVPAPVDEPTCLFSVWLYEETNGIDGLQRWDEVVDDTCHEAIQGDTLVW